MALVFTSADRKAMSRRLVKLDLEIDFFNQAISNNTSDSIVYQESDDMNKRLMDFYNGIAASYETEKRAINGVVAATFDETDIQNSGAELPGNIFYPFDILNSRNNPNLIPGTIDTNDPPDGVSQGMVDEVNGVAASTDTFYEQNILTRPPVAAQDSGNGLTQIINILQSGFTPGAVASTTLTSDYIPGSGSMAVTSGANIANGNYVLAYTPSAGGLFLVKSGGGTTTLTVYEIVVPGGNIVVASSTVTNLFSGFTDSERNTLTAVTVGLQPVLIGLTTTGTSSLISKVLDWETKINTQNSAISTNEEERSTQQGQLSAGTTNNNGTKLSIDNWQALTNTGASGKFVNSSLSTLSTAISGRITAVGTRLAQITTALGLVTDDGDGTVSYSDVTAIYPERYKFVNLRINRSLGTFKQIVSIQKNSGLLQGIVDLLTDSRTEYDQRMVASKLVNDADGTSQIEVEDGSIYAVNDAVYLVSETEAELTLTVFYVDGNKLVLSSNIPAVYIGEDLARVYKLL